MPRFILPGSLTGERFLTLTGDSAQHARVLRLRQGEAVTVCDGTGREFLCAVSDVSDGQYCLVVCSEQPSLAEPRVFASVYVAFAKSDKLEHVIQKATELGAAEIVAFGSARCVSRPDEKSLSKKLERWRKIAASAAEQSGRGAIPEVLVLSGFREAVDRAARAELPVFFYENEDAFTFHDALAPGGFSACALMTGPEGGFSPEEVACAKAAGMKICTLGRRILRCETAPLCALSALMYASGEF